MLCAVRGAFSPIDHVGGWTRHDVKLEDPAISPRTAVAAGDSFAGRVLKILKKHQTHFPSTVVPSPPATRPTTSARSQHDARRDPTQLCKGPVAARSGSLLLVSTCVAVAFLVELRHASYPQGNQRD
jgi:hypothetical protein